MPDTISVRNLTSSVLSVVFAEYNDEPVKALDIKHSNACYSRFGSIFKAGFCNSDVEHSSTPSDLPDKGENKRSRTQQHLAIRLGPFGPHATVNEAAAGEVLVGELGLILEDEHGCQWRIDIATEEKVSRPLIPLGVSPQDQYTGIYLPDSRLLAIVETHAPQKWMQHIPDATALSALSIPGTHNSTTYYKALPSVRCQTVSTGEQLSNGIRFFDVRVQPHHNSNSTDLILVHGAFPISLTGTKTLQPFLDELYGFLAANPSETIILSLKREGTGSSTDHDLARILHEHYITPDRWYTDPGIPSLGAVRGKIVLFRRFALPSELQQMHENRGWGLNAECWKYNAADCVHGAVRVQDFCEVLRPTAIEEKIRYCCEHFERAGSAAVAPSENRLTPSSQVGGDQPLFLNFLSGSNFWRWECWPDKIAAKVNPAVLQYLCERHCAEKSRDGGVGVVICDWVGWNGNWDLVQCILTMNARLW